jgi:hypothetical protein
MAGISAGRVTYVFKPGAVEVTYARDENTMLTIGVKDSGATAIAEASDDQMATFPGIILPRDAGSRLISTDIINVINEVEEVRVEDPELAVAIENSFEDELVGWADISTGETVSTKSVKWDWTAWSRA